MNLGSVHGSVHGFVHGLVYSLIHGVLNNVLLEHGGLPYVPPYAVHLDLEHPPDHPHLRPNQTDFKPLFKNSPNSAAAAVEPLANGRRVLLLYRPIKHCQFKPVKGGMNQLCVCYTSIPLTLALFLPLYSIFRTFSLLKHNYFSGKEISSLRA